MKFKETHVQLCEGLSGAPRSAKLRAHVAALFYQYDSQYVLVRSRLYTEAHQGTLTGEDLAICLATLNRLAHFDPDEPYQKKLRLPEKTEPVEADEVETKGERVLKEIRAKHKLQKQMEFAWNRAKGE